MGMAITDFWGNRWVTNPEWDFQYVIQNAWSLDNPPTIAAEYLYRAIDKAIESVLIKCIEENDEFLGIGASDYKRNITMVITVRTPNDRNRKAQMCAELRRILRTYRYWCGQSGTGYNQIQIISFQDNVDKLRNMSEVIFTISCWRAEKLDDINL